jgi:hypothetical protein
MEEQWRKKGCAHAVNRACWKYWPPAMIAVNAAGRLVDNTPEEQEEYDDQAS